MQILVEIGALEEHRAGPRPRCGVSTCVCVRTEFLVCHHAGGRLVWWLQGDFQAVREVQRRLVSYVVAIVFLSPFLSALPAPGL